MKRWELALLVVLVAEIAIFATANPKFLMPRVIFGSINDIIPICIISLFVTMVMITAGIDIQAGAVVGLASIVLGVSWQDLGLNIWVAALFAIAVAALVGLLTGYIVAYFKVQPMVVTLGGSFLYAGLALLVSTLSSTESYKGISGFPDSFTSFASYRIGGVLPVQVVVFLVMAVFAYVLLHRTKYGRKIFLIGINQNAANRYVEHYLRNGGFSDMVGTNQDVQREKFLGASKLDFLVGNTYLEVKTPLQHLQLDIPDYVKTKKQTPFSSTDRMVKHFQELAGSLAEHQRAILLTCFIYDNPGFQVTL